MIIVKQKNLTTVCRKNCLFRVKKSINNSKKRLRSEFDNVITEPGEKHLDLSDEILCTRMS